MVAELFCATEGLLASLRHILAGVVEHVYLVIFKFHRSLKLMHFCLKIESSCAFRYKNYSPCKLLLKKTNTNNNNDVTI